MKSFFVKFHAIGWTKHAEVNFHSLCRKHPTKRSLCFKNRAYYSWYDSKSWSDPLSSLFWSQRDHQVTKLFKYLMLEGEPSTLKFTYIATITPNEVCALKNMHALHKMTWHYDQNPSVHCFVPNWCQRVVQVRDSEHNVMSFYALQACFLKQKLNLVWLLLYTWISERLVHPLALNFFPNFHLVNPLGPKQWAEGVWAWFWVISCIAGTVFEAQTSFGGMFTT